MNVHFADPGTTLVDGGSDARYNPVWSADGRELYSSGPDTSMSTVKVTTSPSFSFAPGEPIAHTFAGPPPGEMRGSCAREVADRVA